MSCEAVRKRVVGSIPHPVLNYSIAFAKDVHKAYEFLELGLAATYSPENHYCFSIDSKADREFIQHFRMLATCLPNVYLAPERHNMNSAGGFVNRAHLDCLEILIEQPNWEYAVLQQVSDLRSRGPLERGADEHVQGNRIEYSLNWTVEELNFFPKNFSFGPAPKQKSRIDFAKGYVQASLSRAAVHWMTREVNLTKFVEQLNFLNHKGYGVDEQFIATLINSDTLGMPGGFHHRCIKKGILTFMTRYTKWSKPCGTNRMRANQCVWGVEDLVALRNISRRFVMVNKFLPDFDFAGISCMAESIWNRTHYGADPIDEEKLGKHGIKYYNEVLKQQPGFDAETFDCNVTFPK
ncbi:unnamed protein product, partial [Mesorhabditis spiculigera]